MAFDIINDDFSKSAELAYEFELKLPTGADSGAFISVIGVQSPVVKNFSKRKYQEYQQRMQIAKRKGKDDEISLDEAEEMAVEAALIRVVNWRGITESGKEVKFSKEKAHELLKQHSFIRDQVMQESDDVLNFIPKSVNN